jgi:hypothetical protein
MVKAAVLTVLGGYGFDNVHSRIYLRRVRVEALRASMTLVLHEIDSGSSPFMSWPPIPRNGETANHYAERVVGFAAQRRSAAAKFN